MTPWLALSGAEVGAWVAACAGGVALLNQAVQAIRKRQKEKDEIDEALSKAPEVRHQLELGNVGEAVKHLNYIIESQAASLRRQDDRQKSCDGEIERLKERNDALEAEAEGWEKRYEEERRLHEVHQREADRKIEAIQAEMDEMRRTFARTLAQLRRGDDKDEPGEMT